MRNNRLLRSSLLCLALLLVLGSPAFALKLVFGGWNFAGTLVEITDRSVTIVNQQKMEVMRAEFPVGNTLVQTFHAGDKVKVKVVKTQYGTWNLEKIARLE